jgi:hypothetical protein
VYTLHGNTLNRCAAGVRPGDYEVVWVMNVSNKHDGREYNLSATVEPHNLTFVPDHSSTNGNGGTGNGPLPLLLLQQSVQGGGAASEVLKASLDPVHVRKELPDTPDWGTVSGAVTLG